MVKITSSKQLIQSVSELWTEYLNGTLGQKGDKGDKGDPGGITNHPELTNLSYNYSGHTGFSPDTHTHNGYESTTNKGALSGYASLDSNTKVPTIQLGGSGADNTKYLRGDQTWQVPSGGSGLTHPQVLARSLGC